MVEQKHTSEFYDEIEQFCLKNTEKFRKTVMLAQTKEDGTQVVITKYFFGMEELQRQFESECLTIIQNQQNESVMQVLDFYEDEEGATVVVHPYLPKTLSA